MKRILTASAACAVLLLATNAFAADLGAELSTAQTHAGLAAKAANIDGVHMHMHHALNCLVGPKGTGFDSTNLNPCAQSGNGAIPDSTDAAQKGKLQTAVDQLNSGLAASDMTTAAKDAADASATIASAK